MQLAHGRRQFGQAQSLQDLAGKGLAQLLRVAFARLGDALGEKVGARPRQIAKNVVAQEVGVLDELDRAWSEIQEWLRALMRAETDDMVAEELLVFPGMEELISLRAVREVEATGDYDVCVVDCAPTGATLRMLRFPDALRIFMEHFFDLERRGVRLLRPLLRRMGGDRLLPGEDFFDAFERLYRDVEDVRQILLDRDRTSARLVVKMLSGTTRHGVVFDGTAVRPAASKISACHEERGRL